jgi:hypothetical protein
MKLYDSICTVIEYQGVLTLHPFVEFRVRLTELFPPPNAVLLLDHGIDAVR